MSWHFFRIEESYFGSIIDKRSFDYNHLLNYAVKLLKLELIDLFYLIIFLLIRSQGYLSHQAYNFEDSKAIVNRAAD